VAQQLNLDLGCLTVEVNLFNLFRLGKVRYTEVTAEMMRTKWTSCSMVWSKFKSHCSNLPYI